jgi:hypothetical protein
MAQKTYSSTLTDHTEEITNLELQGSLSEITRSLGMRSFKLKAWNDGYIALPLKLEVDLPSLGNYKDLDIRPIEPVVLVFDLKRYPAAPPTVYTDRLDFPKDQLAHLYIAKKGRPPAFCLVRGSMADWYAAKRPADLPIRVKNWLRDAALGTLTEDGNQFDPLRIEGYSGRLIFDYDTVTESVVNNQSYEPELNFALAVFKRTADLTFKFKQFVTKENQDVVNKMLLEAAKKKEDETNAEHFHIGYILWDRNGSVHDHYQIDHPETWPQLVEFASKYGIDFTEFERFLCERDQNTFRGIPVTLAIRRPKQVIGYSGTLEFSNHIVILDATHKEDSKITSELPVLLFVHNQPLTEKLARRISGVNKPMEGISLVAGCGALGSKITTHLARSGQINMVLTDPDKLSPHNMVRHALLPEQIGLNKAKALADAIKDMYPDQGILPLGLAALTDPNLKDQEDKDVYKFIFDFTASDSFLNTLVNARKLQSRIVRANISDSGNLGILLIEGQRRSPRIDDLQVSLYQKYSELPWVKDWLQGEAQKEDAGNVMITVGVGCNSETTLLADDYISTHAAYMSMNIKQESQAEQSEDGKIFLSRIKIEDNYAIQTEVLTVPPFVSTFAKNGSGWEIRYASHIIETVKAQMGLKMPNETGGVYLGSVNYKTRTIHVVDIITEPADSVSDEICFHRGVQGLPEKVKGAHEGSGGQIGYIGEWHTHPFGPNTLSTKDMQTARKFKHKLDQMDNPLPVFLTIVTPVAILPYVF